MLQPDWSLNWMALSIMNLRGLLMMRNVLNSLCLLGWRFCDSPTGISTGIFVVCAHKLILSFEKGCKTLSVTYGDSSPKGRAKGLHPIT